MMMMKIFDDYSLTLSFHSHFKLLADPVPLLVTNIIGCQGVPITNT